MRFKSIGFIAIFAALVCVATSVNAQDFNDLGNNSSPDKGITIPWYSPFHPDYHGYSSKTKQFADYIRVNKEMLKLKMLTEAHPPTTSGIGAGTTACEFGILGASFGPALICIDLLAELYAKDQEDWDGDGIPNGQENQPDVYDPVGVFDAVLNVALQSGPNNDIGAALEHLETEVAISTVGWYIWWIGGHGN